MGIPPQKRRSNHLMIFPSISSIVIQIKNQKVEMTTEVTHGRSLSTHFRSVGRGTGTHAAFLRSGIKLASAMVRKLLGS